MALKEGLCPTIEAEYSRAVEVAANEADPEESLLDSSFGLSGVIVGEGSGVRGEERDGKIEAERMAVWLCEYGAGTMGLKEGTDLFAGESVSEEFICKSANKKARIEVAETEAGHQNEDRTKRGLRKRREEGVEWGELKCGEEGHKGESD